MFEPLIALALFCGVVWVIAHAIFLIIHVDRDDDSAPRRRDSIASFIDENYGKHFLPEHRRDDDGRRKR